jgi:hypothetical protein
MKQLGEVSVPEVRAIRELRGPGRLDMDLDGDGRVERIDCHAGRFLQCTVRDSRGKELAALNVARRIGVLATRSGGFADLVAGRDLVLRWTGSTYE